MAVSLSDVTAVFDELGEERIDPRTAQDSRFEDAIERCEDVCDVVVTA